MLDLYDLAAGMPGMTPAHGTVLAEAASVCLESQGHEPGVWLTVIAAVPARYELRWSRVTEQMRRDYNDADEATEFGASGVAVLLARDVTGLNVVQRMPRMTGCDYWIGDADDGTLQNKRRLEVSGIRRGSRVDLAARIRQKAAQTRQSDATEKPALVVVVEFGEPAAQVASR